jgi:hypothetical protein
MASRLPYYAATAWHHKMLPADLQSKDLTDVLPEVEEFTINELIPAITRGGSLDDDKRKAIAAKMSRYSGLKEKSDHPTQPEYTCSIFLERTVA